MKIKSIVLVSIAVLLIMGSMAGITTAGVEDWSGRENFKELQINDEEWRFDARYWWEVPPVTPYDREQIKDIMIMVLDRYFGIDISRMSPEEFEGIAKCSQNEMEILRLFGYYAQKREFEVPTGIFDAPPGFDEPLGIPARVKPSPKGNRVYRTTEEIYWWKAVANPEEEVNKIMQDIAGVKGMSSDEIEERFDELFPGVDLWEMSLAEFYYFVGSLPQPSLKVLCLEEEKQQPHVIAVFGKVPELSAELEIKEFDEKLRRIIQAVPSSVWDSILSSSVEQVPREQENRYPVVATGASQGVITIGLPNRDFTAIGEIYKIISEKAKSLYEIKDVPVMFSGDASVTFATWTPLPPYGARYRPIPGGVAIQSSGGGGATSGFAVVQRRPLWGDDEDYVTTGHLAGLNTRIYQPAIGSGNEAGRIIARPGRRSHADVARVGIADALVHPRIHVGHGFQRPVFSAGDPGINERVVMSGATSGPASGRVITYVNLQFGPGAPYDVLYNQIIVEGVIPQAGDSGSPLLVGVRLVYPYCIRVHGVTVGDINIGGARFGIFSPITGILRELPGIEVWLSR